MARSGGFEGIKPAAVSYLGYIRLTGAAPPGEIREAGESPGDQTPQDAIADLSRQTIEGLKLRIAQFDNIETPYLCRISPKNEEAKLDYDHLSRYREWAVLQDWEERSK